MVSISASSDLTTAGDLFNLTCSAVILNNLISNPILIWSGPGVNQINVQSSSEALNLTLSFSPLHTSHGGVYICRVRLLIPEAGVDVSETQTTIINVQSKQFVASKVHIISRVLEFYVLKHFRCLRMFFLC